MGFFGSLIKGVVGAATGGVGNAVLGLAGDVLGGMSGSKKSSTTTGSTQSTQLRDWTPEEQAAYSQAMAGLASAGQPMTAANEAALRDKIYQANYQPAAQAIQTGLATAQANDYASAARRGAANSSATVGQGATNNATAARELGLASQNATIAAENAKIQEEQQRQQAAANYVATINALWTQRLNGSSIVNTGTSTANDGGGSTLENILGGIGSAIGNKDSWLNQNVLGKKKSSPSGGGTGGGTSTTVLGSGSSRNTDWNNASGRKSA